jgi:predicted aspartyl protease/Flp pilus assembly protein TadD
MAYDRCRARFTPLRALAAAFLLPASLLAHAASCSVAQPHPLTPEQIASISGNLPEAENLYRQKIQQPKNFELTADLARVLIEEQKIDDADSTLKAALATAPQSVELLTAEAELQFRQGIPWDEEKTLRAAQQADPCYPRLHLTLADYYRFNSYYASSLHEIKTAHQLDPYDPSIRHEWMHTLPLRQRIDELKKYLAAHDTDVDSIRRAERELALLENRLENRAGTCHLASSVATTDIPFTPILIDAERIRGWGLDVALNDHKARLQVDTGATGLYVSRIVAEHAGLKPVTQSQASGVGDKGAQSGYIAYADSIKIGALEFKNCLVEVSDRRNVVGVGGLIGMDVFSNFLVTLDFPWRKLTLGPLPPYPDATQTPTTLNTQEESPAESTEASSAGETASGPPPAQDAKAAPPAPPPTSGPHDRYIAPEMKSWNTVYRVGHQLIVPTALNQKRLRLFIIDTGAQSTSISPSAARDVTKVHSDPNTTLRGLSGNVQNVYTGDKVVFRFAHLQQEKDNVLSFDTSSISKNTGTEISGFIGFDMLGLLVVKIDYRDGLMDFNYSENRGYQHIR